MTTEPDWGALAEQVRRRRERKRLPVDLSGHGGPAEMTVRKIEAAESALIRPKTKTRLERALDWPDGLVDRILDGTATAEELNDVVVRGAASANLGGLTAQAGTDETALTVGRMAELIAGSQSSATQAAARVAIRDQLTPVSEVALRAAMPEIEALRAQLDKVVRPVLSENAAWLQSSGIATSLLASSRMMEEMNIGVSGLAAGAQAAVEAFGGLGGPERRLLVDMVLPPVDLSHIFSGVGASMRAWAIPPPDPEKLALWEEFERKLDKIEAEPWFDEDMDIADAVRRYNEAHPDDEHVPVHHHREVADHVGVTDAVVASVTHSESTVTAHAEPPAEPPLADVVTGPWSTVIVAQQEVGDVQDLALASELFARVSRRPASEERTVQLRALNGLIEEFIGDREDSGLSLRWRKEDAPSRRGRRDRPTA